MNNKYSDILTLLLIITSLMLMVNTTILLQYGENTYTTSEVPLEVIQELN